MGFLCLILEISVHAKTFSIKIPVLRIRTGFSADPDPAFYLNVDPDPDWFMIKNDKNIDKNLN